MNSERKRRGNAARSFKRLTGKKKKNTRKRSMSISSRRSPSYKRRISASRKRGSMS